MEQNRIAVIGAGSWGTALAILLGAKGYPVTLWGHREEHVAAINRCRENTDYLPGFRLPETIRVTADLGEAVRNQQIILMVVPSHVSRVVLKQLTPLLAQGAYLISASKGIENDTLMTMTQVMEDVLPVAFHQRLAILSGPSFAREVAGRVPTAVTIAAKLRENAAFLQERLSGDRFRVYASTDIRGLELGGALKNIVAIAAGICDGLGYGTNTRAALITRGLAEITRLGVKMGAKPLTFSGLAGLGDLVLTCTGDLSRNRMVGLKLGQGKQLDEILKEMKMVAEGVKTTRSAMELARRQGVEMPILEQVYEVLYNNKQASEAVKDLLATDLKEELEY